VQERTDHPGRRRQFGRSGGRVPVYPGQACAHADPQRQPGFHHVQLSDRTDRGDAEYHLHTQRNRRAGRR
jgi:hypothetical protein